MLLLSIKSTLSQSKVLFQPLIHKQTTSKLKCISSCHNISSRHYSIKLKEKDKKLESIYYGPLTPQIKSVKIFSLSSSVAGLLAQPIIIREAATIGSRHSTFEPLFPPSHCSRPDPTSLLVAICSVVGFFTFITPLLLHLITKKYVTEIHYDPETSTYKATTINFFLARKQLDFKTGDVEVPDVPGMFTTMNAKGTPLFIEARHFSDPWHYAKIMGYDKPMDFKLGEQDSSDSEKK